MFLKIGCKKSLTVWGKLQKWACEILKTYIELSVGMCNCFAYLSSLFLKVPKYLQIKVK